MFSLAAHTATQGAGLSGLGKFSPTPLPGGEDKQNESVPSENFWKFLTQIRSF